jgi:hypothetical protein
MDTFIFKFGQDEYICKAADATSAKLKADNFVDRERDMVEPYGWVPSSEGANIFRMSVGA